MLRFVVVDAGSVPSTPGLCLLKVDGWDDYGFKTLFELSYSPDGQNLLSIGAVKIGHLNGSTSGRFNRRIDTEFEGLDNSYFSLGTSQGYYENIRSLGSQGLEILHRLRDVIVDEDALATARSTDVYRSSLLRDSTEKSLTPRRHALEGTGDSSSFGFTYRFPQQSTEIAFSVDPNLKPPRHVQVVVGRNGSGKSTLLRNIAVLHSSITGEMRSMSIADRGVLTLDETFTSGFSNVIAISFSAFDPFEETRSPPTRYTYVGLRGDGIDAREDTHKSPSMLDNEFGIVADECWSGARRDEFSAAIELLQSDPILRDEELTELSGVNAGDERCSEAAARFSRLSSGHRIALLVVAHLVKNVANRSLVLIDEPETHLHPPLTASLLRAINVIVSRYNAMAIVATHSPVVLQEVPSQCVTIVERWGDVVTARRPTIETFAENVGLLTREVFRLELEQSGYYLAILEAVGRIALLNPSLSAYSLSEKVLSELGNQVGLEGRAILQSVISRRAQ